MSWINDQFAPCQDNSNEIIQTLRPQNLENLQIRTQIPRHPIPELDGWKNVSAPNVNVPMTRIKPSGIVKQGAQSIVPFPRPNKLDLGLQSDI